MQFFNTVYQKISSSRYYHKKTAWVILFLSILLVVPFNIISLENPILTSHQILNQDVSPVSNYTLPYYSVDQSFMAYYSGQHSSIQAILITDPEPPENTIEPFLVMHNSTGDLILKSRIATLAGIRTIGFVNSSLFYILYDENNRLDILSITYSTQVLPNGNITSIHSFKFPDTNIQVMDVSVMNYTIFLLGTGFLSLNTRASMILEIDYKTFDFNTYQYNNISAIFVESSQSTLYLYQIGTHDKPEPVVYAMDLLGNHSQLIEFCRLNFDLKGMLVTDDGSLIGYSSSQIYRLRAEKPEILITAPVTISSCDTVDIFLTCYDSFKNFIHLYNANGGYYGSFQVPYAKSTVFMIDDTIYFCTLLLKTLSIYSIDFPSSPLFAPTLDAYKFCSLTLTTLFIIGTYATIISIIMICLSWLLRVKGLNAI